MAALKEKLGGSHREIWAIVKENADRHVSRAVPSNFDNQGDMREAGRGIPWQALAFLMTGESEYLAGARKWLLAVCEFPRWENNRSLAAGECLFGVACGYDWLHHQLTAKQRSFTKEKLIRQADLMRNGPPVHHDRWLANHNHVEHLGLAAAGFALFDELPRAVEWIRQSDIVFGTLLRLAASDGSSTEGHQYWAYTTEALLRYAELARDLLGKDLYGSEWLRSVPNFILHSTLPGFDADNCVMSFGDSHREYSSHGPTHILYRLAAEYRNPHAQWLAKEMERRRVGRDAYCTWANLLWYDETLAAAPLSSLPVFWRCDDIGWVTARSGWEEEAVMVGFKCGPMHGHKVQRYYESNRGAAHEIAGGHGHPDVNSFQVYARRKWLAIDPGYERPKWTRTHNCVLVNGRGQLGEGQTWFDREAVLRAGATSATVKAEHTPACDYVVGDAMNIYPPETGLRKFHRHLLFVRPDFVILVDDLQASPRAVFDWLLQAETAVRKKSEDAFLIGGSEVNLDVRFVLPEDLRITMDGRTLTASAGPRSDAVIVTVLHPRPADAPPATSELTFFGESRISLRIGAGERRMTVELDIARQRPSVTRV